MKLKELPLSIYTTVKLKLRSAEKLKKVQGNELPIVVSLTSIALRLKTLHITIRSILSLPQRPEKIIIWLNESLKDNIPNSLLQLEGDLVEIRFTHLYSSHKKLVHTIELFPDAIIVTCDDDAMYRKGWLASLYTTHLKYPNYVIANRTRCINRDEHGTLLPYKTWNCTNTSKKESVLPIGAEGVLYPKNIFPAIVTDEELFLQLAPKADDLWFKAVALSNGVYAKKSEHTAKDSIPILGTQKTSLKNTNIKQGKNVEQWEQLSNYFKLSI